MDRWATKDHYERETEEADRLVRPDPKWKPPRTDRRREEMETDRDPDIEGDRDVAKDPDLSLNRKNIGGSTTARRVLARFLLRGEAGVGGDAGDQLIKVRHKGTGKVVRVKKKTLEAKPADYEEIKEEEEEAPESPFEMWQKLPPGKIEKPGEKPSEPGKAEKPPEPEPEKIEPWHEEVPQAAPAKKEEEAPATEKSPETEEAKPKPGEKDDAFYAGAGRELLDAAETDLKLQGVLKDIADPKSDLGGMAGYAPQLPAAPFLKGMKVPEGIENLGDLQKAALHGQKALKAEPKPKGKPKGKPEKGAPAGEETPAWASEQLAVLKEIRDKLQGAAAKLPPEHREEVEDQIKELDKAQEDLKEAEPKPPKGKEAPTKPSAEPPKPGQAPPLPSKEEREKVLRDSQNKRIVEKWKAEKGGEAPEWQEHLKELPTTKTDKNGKPVFIDPKTKKEVPFESLPAGTQAKLISEYESKRKGDAAADALKKALVGNNQARAAIEDMFDPESETSKKIAELAKKHDLDELPAAKNLPELAEVLPKDVKTIADLQHLVQSKADLFQKQPGWKAWLKDTQGHGPTSPHFRQWAKKQGLPLDEDSRDVLFPKGKKAVPWDKLSDDEKARVFEGYDKYTRAGKLSKDIGELAHDNRDLANALFQLGNPASDAAQYLAGVTNLNDKKVAKALPALRNLTLPAGMTFGDLVEAAKTTFGPPPPPVRRKASEDEVTSAYTGLYRTFKHQPRLGQTVIGLGLHPADARQVIRTYNQAKLTKIPPDQLDARIKEAKEAGLYEPNPDAILPPKSGRNAKGKPTSWDNLTSEEQSEAYARHRNEVIATTAALRDQVAETLKNNMGVPPMAARTLALAKLSHKPGETDVERTQRARVLGKKIVENVLHANKPAHPISDYDVKNTLAAMGDDPLAQSFAVAYLQANDYQHARKEWLDPNSPRHIDEREPTRNIASRLKEASAYLRKQEKLYPASSRHGSMAERFRKRILDRMMALNPKKAAELEPEIQKMDADDWDSAKADHDKLAAQFKKDSKKYEQAKAKAESEYEAEVRKQGKGYREPAGPIKSVADRLAEAKVREPIPPEPLPMKPNGYDLVRKSPRAQQQSAGGLWQRLLRGLTASERVAGRFLYSSCEASRTMGSPAPTDRHASAEKTGVYWGVDPATTKKVVNVPHVPWQQAHARDLGEKDYNAILAAAREWMKVPVLARILDEGTTGGNHLGAVRDIQLRAALDLAIRDMEGGKYAVGLHPHVYNDLLARLAGKSEQDKDTLVTQRQASEIEAAPKGYTKDPSGKWVKGPGAKERKELEESDVPLGNVERHQLEKLKKKGTLPAPASRSLYSQATGEDRPMNAASEIRKFAAEIAAQHPGLAFDLTNLAFKVAQQDQQEQGQQQEGQDKKPDFLKDKDAAKKYAALKGLVIKTASSNPAIRTALVPVLQLLKQHQGG